MSCLLRFRLAVMLSAAFQIVRPSAVINLISSMLSFIAPYVHAPVSELYSVIRISSSIACTSSGSRESFPPGLLLVFDSVWPPEWDADSPANTRVCAPSEKSRSPVVADQPGTAAPAEHGGGFAVSCRSK